MPFVKISSEVTDTMKKYLADVEGVSLGELVEGAIIYAMENLEAFEKFLGIEEDSDESEDGTDKEDTDDTETDEQDAPEPLSEKETKKRRY